MNKFNISQHKLKTFYEFIYGDSSLPKFKDAKFAYDYIVNNNLGRQEEIELYIMEDPEYAYKYAKNILKGRWENAEPYIRNSRYASLYAKNVLNGDWPVIKPETDSIINYKDQGSPGATILPVKM